MFTGCMTKDSGRMIPAGANQTVDSFWSSCEADEIRLKYQQEPKCSINGSSTSYHVGEEFRDGIFHWLCLETGRWVTGCYYQNETKDWVLLRIGQVGYNGLIRHTCDRYKDNPGIVQYHAEVRTTHDAQ
ncbi:Protein Y47D3B.3 [Aphelenchoides avenae]|nr:Protein Y47D3B.3 [Aphelenchus avenae]